MKRRVLLIEDAPAHVELVRAHLPDDVFDVVHEATLAGAMKTLADRHFDVVLLDLCLPDAGDLAALRLIRSKAPAVPVVVLTALDDDEIGIAALEHGAQDCISKSRIDSVLFPRTITHAIQRAKLEAELVRSSQFATIGQLAAGVAHEINNPATTILSAAAHVENALARLEGPSDDIAQVRGAIREAEASVSRIAKITQELLAFARCERHSVEEIDINDLVAITCDLAQFDFQGRAVLERQHAELPKIHGHRGRLSHALLGLLKNAAEALPETTRGTETVRVSTRRQAGHVVVTVTDPGPGISQELSTVVFEPFFTTKDRGRHPGLGLTVALDIVRQHRGRIEIQRRDGGTTIHVHIPYDTGMKAPPRRVSSKPRNPKKRVRVLVIDDDAMLRRSLARVLKRTHEIVEAESGESGLKKVLAEDFDIILSDVVMPGLNGERLYRLVQQEKPEAARRFVFMTGGGLTHASRDFLHAVNAPIVTKPIRAEELLELFDTVRAGLE